MVSWDSQRYLRFARERTQPSRDLAARLRASGVREAIDLGCGPGNSTSVLADALPDARVMGADSSPSMLERARLDHPGLEFVTCDLSQELPCAWQGRFDVVFSNACLHWVPNHELLFPRLLGLLADGGQLAVQIPVLDEQVMYHEVIFPAFEALEGEGRATEGSQRNALSDVAYLDLLGPLCGEVEVWKTTYYHLLPSAEAVVDWYRGSGLRPILDVLEDDGSEREELLERALEAARSRYTVTAAGEYLVRMPRLFILATL